MSAAAVGSHSSAHSTSGGGAGGHLSLMSCVRESSPPQDFHPPAYDIEKTVGTKRKFWDVRKWFKRKNKHVEDTSTTPNDGLIEPKDTLRSRSTSELFIAEDQIRRRSGTPMHPGLSVSHDSVFHSPHSGSELDLDAAQSSSSLSVHHHPLQPDIRLQSELTKKLQQRRHRGDTSEDDEGLPRSPCNSPSTTDGIFEKTAIKDNPTKSHSTCSDGSLLSMGSSEMDEDSFGQHSRHSSKLSLHDKRTPESEISDFYLGTQHTSAPLAPLNHSAAHHKMAVRPRRTHGVPRRSRVAVGPTQKSVSALPTTPEVNEDSSIRSITPDTSMKDVTPVATSAAPVFGTHLDYKMRPLALTMTEAQIKCSSLPPGLLGPGAIDANKLNRSCSNAGTKSQDIFATLEEDDEKEEKKTDSFLGWLLPRKSGRKKKNKVVDKEGQKSAYTHSSSTLEVSTNYSTTSSYISTVDYSRPVAIDANLSIRPNALLRTGPASRQRVNPIDIPVSPDFYARSAEASMLPRFSPEQVSPFQAELRQKLGTSPTRISESPLDYYKSSNQINSYMNSLGFNGLESMRFTQPELFATPPVDYNTPPESPKSPWSEHKHISAKISTTSKCQETIIDSLEFIKSRARLPGLSALQQKVLSLNEDDLLDGGCKSLTDFLDNRKAAKPVMKSHSFKSANQLQRETLTHSYVTTNKDVTITDKKEISKAASLDSVKNLDNRLVETINETKVEATRVEVEKRHIRLQECDSITISGPSHKAVVSIANDVSTANGGTQENQDADKKSVIKIQLKTNSSHTSLTNRVLDATIKSKSDNDVKLDITRRFSKDNIEVIDMDDDVETESPFKKNIVMSIIPQSNDKTNKIISESLVSQKKSVVNITLNSLEDSNPPKLFPDIKMTKMEAPVKTEVKSHIPILQKSSSNICESSIILRDSKKSVTTTHEKKSSHIEKSLSLNAIKSHLIKESLMTQDRISTYTSVSETVVLHPAQKDARANVTVLKPMNVSEKSNDIQKEIPSEKPSSPIRPKPILLPKSVAVEMATKKVQEAQNGDKNLDNNHNCADNVVMRRKSVAKTSAEDEPELMKVFARRSLKLKDSDTDALSQQVLSMVDAESETTKRDSSDKENQSDASPPEERRKSINKEPPKNKELPKKEPLLETTDLVPLRKPIVANNKFTQYQRTVSLNAPARIENKIVKQMSLVDRPKTDSWIHTKNENDDSIESQPEIITSCLTAPEPDVIAISKPQNFNQRKAEWEKRAQEALKKNSP